MLKLMKIKLILFFIFTSSISVQAVIKSKCTEPIKIVYALDTIAKVFSAIPEKSLPALHDQISMTIGCPVNVIQVPLPRLHEFVLNNNVDILIGKSRDATFDSVADFFPYVEVYLNLLVKDSNKNIKTYSDFINSTSGETKIRLGAVRGYSLPEGELKSIVEKLKKNNSFIELRSENNLIDMMNIDRVDVAIGSNILFLFQPDPDIFFKSIRLIKVPDLSPSIGFYISKNISNKMDIKTQNKLKIYFQKLNKNRGLKNHLEYYIGYKVHKKYFNQIAH